MKSSPNDDLLVILLCSQEVCLPLSISTPFPPTLYPAGYCSTPKVGVYYFIISFITPDCLSDDGGQFVHTALFTGEEKTNDTTSSPDKSTAGNTNHFMN